MLAVTRYNAFLQRKSKTENHLVLNSVKSTQGMLLFSRERRRPRITQPKRGLSLPLGQYYFPETGKTQNRSLKNSVKVSLGTMLCSQEKKSKAEKHPDKSSVDGIRVQCYFTERDHGGVRLEITQSKVASTIHRVQSYCPKKG